MYRTGPLVGAIAPFPPARGRRRRLWMVAPIAVTMSLLSTGIAAAAMYPYPPPPPGPTPTPVSVATKSNLHFGTILSDGNQMTLYTLTNNGAPVLCSGMCTTPWPPLVLTAGQAAPTDPPGVTGIATTMNANGTQVTEQGLPLYRFAGDSVPADANGEGINSFGGVWHVVKVPTAPAACTPGPLTPAPTGMVKRLAGSDRDATSVVISQAEFPMGAAAGAVVLASDANYPDALAGTPLAVKKHAPLLLTTSSGLSASVSAEIARVVARGAVVYLLGGDTALAASVDAQVQALGDTPQRIAGADRFATASAIAGVLGDPHAILEATGFDFADALSAGSAAAQAAGAILLTNGTSQAAPTSAYLAAHAGDARTAIGGPAATADPGATPLAGADRFATSAMVAQKYFSAPSAFGFASGTTFPDALAGGAAIGSAGGPMLLVPACGTLPASSSSYLGTIKATVKTAWLYGGVQAVGDDVLAALEQAA